MFWWEKGNRRADVLARSYRGGAPLNYIWLLQTLSPFIHFLHLSVRFHPILPFHQITKIAEDPPLFKCNVHLSDIFKTLSTFHKSWWRSLLPSIEDHLEHQGEVQSSIWSSLVVVSCVFEISLPVIFSTAPLRKNSHFITGMHFRWWSSNLPGTTVLLSHQPCSFKTNTISQIEVRLLCFCCSGQCTDFH